MIVVYVNHGLGNQMFQYAYGLVLGKKTNSRKIMFDLTEVRHKIAGRKMWDVNKIFVGNFPKCDFIHLWQVTGHCPVEYWYKRIINPDAEELARNVTGRTVLVSEPKSRCAVTPQKVREICDYKWIQDKDYYVLGYWEDIDYFHGYEALVRRHFRFQHTFSASEIKKYKKIFSENSVSVHIRRGDYLKVRKPNNFCICVDDYYFEAITRMQKELKDPFFVFFSDDPEYVKAKYKWLASKMIVEGNRDYIDLQLMTLCKHNILANSTFSFWGAFLNSNKRKKVICPRVHYLLFQTQWHEIPFPAESTWIKLDNTKSG